MAMVHNQINRAINTAISEKVLPEIQNIVSSMSSSGNRDTEAGMSPSSQENRENSSGVKTKLSKKDSRSVGDLRDATGRGSYTTSSFSWTNWRKNRSKPFRIGAFSLKTTVRTPLHIYLHRNVCSENNFFVWSVGFVCQSLFGLSIGCFWNRKSHWKPGFSTFWIRLDLQLIFLT